MNRLKELRNKKGINQLEVANYLGITSQAYGNYESERRQPDPETLLKLADYFNVSVDYLLGRKERDTAEIVVPDNMDNVPVAFFEGLKDLSQEDMNAVSDFVEFLKSKKK